jgi:transposase
MPSLTTKTIRGHEYHYLRECQRVNGKPKIVWQEYIGTRESLVRRLTCPEPQEAELREFGGSAACFDVASELDLVATIDRHVPKRKHQGPTVGQYLVVAALNRCLAPCSKARLASWYKRTILPRLLGVRPAALSSQRFWDNMSRVDEAALQRIESELSRTAVSRFDLDLHFLLFDCTNFFTFVDSFNDRCEMAQRGKSKEGRANLRIVGLALLVTADHNVPLFSHAYPGNQHDSTTFQSVAADLARRCRDVGRGACDITLIFDKGNNSQENLEAVENGPCHFVGSLVPTQHPELLAVKQSQMRRLDKRELPAVWAWRTTKKVFGVERTVVVTYNRGLFDAQRKTLVREINKRKRALGKLQSALERAAQRRAGKLPTVDGTKKKVDALLSARHMGELFKAEVTTGPDGLPRLAFAFEEDAWVHLCQTLLGKTLLFTDREEWRDEQVVLAYRSQSHVEAAFREMKDPRFLTFRPSFHWTDQKLRVHAFYCVVALMILSLLRRKLAKAGIKASIAKTMEALTGIREVDVLYPTPANAPPRIRTILSTTDNRQRAMLDALNLHRHRPA